MNHIADLPSFNSLAWAPAFDHVCQLGESPYWCGDSQRLVWVDIGAMAVLRGDPLTRQVERWPMPSSPGCVAPMPGGGFVMGLRDGVFVAEGWGGVLRQVWAYSPLADGLRLNDGKADALGNFWVGSYSERREPTAMLVGLRPRAARWEAICHEKGFAASNGLACPEDASHLYWADTPGHRVLRYEQGADGQLSSPRTILQLSAKPSGWDAQTDPDHTQYAGRPDGACLDSEGAYWVALYEGSALLRISASGQVLARLRTPSLRTTMPCFGGPDLRTLFVTTAQPDGGTVWSTRVDVPGVPVHAVGATNRATNSELRGAQIV